DLGRKRQLVLRVRLNIPDPQSESFTEGTFGFEVPGKAVGCEVAVSVLLMDEGVVRLRGLADDVEVSLGSIGDVSLAVVPGDGLLRVVIERIGTQRDGIVKHSQASAN